MTGSVTESGIRKLAGPELEQVQGGVGGALILGGVAVLRVALSLLGNSKDYGTGTCNTDGTYTT
jgi:hypothetical protein